MNLPCWVLFRPALCCLLILSPLGLRWLPRRCWWSTSSVQIHFLREEVAFVWKPWLLLQVFRLTWWNRPCRSCFGSFLLQLGTQPRYRWLLASERSWHMLVNFLLQNMTLILVNLHRFVHCWSPQESQAACTSGTCTCRNIDSISAVRAIGPSRNLSIVPISPFSRSGPANNLSFRHITLYFAAALQTRQILPGFWGLVLDGVTNTIPFQKCLWLPIYQGSSQIPFQHLYQLTVDTILLILGLVGIFVPVSGADQGLSRSCLEDWLLVHSRACPLRTARLKLCCAL